EYAHVPMILGDDGKRLSKRHGAVGVMEYFDAGYLPQAMLNYLVRLGWSYGDQEIFTRQEMTDYFSLDALNKSPSSFNSEKLNWINQQYLMSLPLDEIVTLVMQRLDRLEIDYDRSVDLAPIVDLYRQRVVTINELVDSIDYCFRDFESYDEKAAARALKLPALEPLQRAQVLFTELESWDAVSIHAVIQQITKELDVGMGKVGQPLRVAVTGGSFSPPIDQTLELLGRQRSIARVARAIDYVTTIK
ncbi:MAG: glutamate--tRNA ligase, partial [Gammaproteobacteria bacterium]